jgi:uncharacterized protein YfaS (alpha-2-macroglobulin family)
MRRLPIALVLLAVAALGLGLLTATALAGKKSNTNVVFFGGSPSFNSGGQVKAKGALNTVSACRISRGVKLQLLDATGVVTSVLDGSSTDSNGNWIVSGKLPAATPAGTYSVRVKANKASAGKFVCKAGVSPSVPVPATK